MELIHVEHYSGSISEFYFDGKRKSIVEVKRTNDGADKEYVYDLATFDIGNLRKKSSYGYHYAIKRSMDQYRQTKDSVYNK